MSKGWKRSCLPLPNGQGSQKYILFIGSSIGKECLFNN